MLRPSRRVSRTSTGSSPWVVEGRRVSGTRECPGSGGSQSQLPRELAQHWLGPRAARQPSTCRGGWRQCRRSGVATQPRRRRGGPGAVGGGSAHGLGGPPRCRLWLTRGRVRLRASVRAWKNSMTSSSPALKGKPRSRTTGKGRSKKGGRPVNWGGMPRCTPRGMPPKCTPGTWPKEACMAAQTVNDCALAGAKLCTAQRSVFQPLRELHKQRRRLMPLDALGSRATGGARRLVLEAQ